MMTSINTKEVFYMKTIRQLCRQPAKLIAGILIVSIAVAVLCVCLGQSISAHKTEAALEHHFTTVALPTIKYNYADSYFVTFSGDKIPYTKWNQELPADITAWIDQTVQTRTDLVETLASPGLASAYIPALTPDHLTDHTYHHPDNGTMEARGPHQLEAQVVSACAMLEVELTEVGAADEMVISGTKEDGTPVNVTTCVTVKMAGTIKSVISLDAGYDDPTGRTIYLTLELSDMESLENLHLEVGQRYLVYGHDYLDGDWVLRGKIADNLNLNLTSPVDISEVDTDQMVMLTEEEKMLLMKANEWSESPFSAYYYHDRLKLRIANVDILLKDAAMLTIRDEAAFGVYQIIRHETDGYPTMNWTHQINGEDGAMIQISQEEWQTRYGIPTIVRLEGTPEAFLQSEEGARWRQQQERMAINFRAFPVIGVEKLGYIADFARENARIVAGRDFTAEELRSGAKVCILSETVAAASGLTVGDTITPQFYNYDLDDPNQPLVSESMGVVNPSAYRYTTNTAFAPAEEYVIVGLYRQSNAWEDVSNNVYSFTPNTIFVPHASVPSDMDYGNQAFFQTLVLKNGAINAFRTAVNDAGYEGLFVFYDQGYTEIAQSLNDYQEVAQRAVLIGTVVYGVLMLLFLLFFPGSQKKPLSTMRALGAPRKQKVAHLLMISAGICVPGTAIGVLAGMLLWQRVVEVLAENAGAMVTLKMDLASLCLVALAQLILMIVLTLLLSIPMTRERGLAGRK